MCLGPSFIVLFVAATSLHRLTVAIQLDYFSCKKDTRRRLPRVFLKVLFWSKITFALGLGNSFESVSSATDLNSIVFPVRSNCRTTRFRAITDYAVFWSFCTVMCSVFLSYKNLRPFFHWINTKVAVNLLLMKNGKK